MEEQEASIPSPLDGTQFKTAHSALRLDLPVPGGGAFIGAVLYVQSARDQPRRSSGKWPRTIKARNLGGGGLSFEWAQVRVAGDVEGRWGVVRRDKRMYSQRWRLISVRAGDDGRQ